MNTMKKQSTRFFSLFLVMICSAVLPLWAQQAELTFEDIERNSAYVWGRGVGTSLEEADKHALQDLASQVSVSVDNRIETTIENVSQAKGENLEAQELQRSKVSTTGDLRVSSSVSLANCKRMVKEEGGTFIVLRYVPAEEVEKMYDGRKDKIGELIRAGERAQERNKVGDALRNFYWALKMTLSIPPEHQGDEGRVVASHLREQIGDILDSIEISVAKIEKGEDANTAELAFLYRGQPMTNGDFQYFDGYDWIWSSIKDGVGVAEISADMKTIPLRVEYEYQRLWKSDPMVEEILEQRPTRIPYRQSERHVSTGALKAENPAPVKNAKAVVKEITVDSLSICNKKEVTSQADIIAPLIQAIEKRAYDDVRGLCSDNGWRWFEKLVKYGNAKIIERNALQMTAFANGYLVRGIKASFSFKKNNKKFVEDLVFYIKDNKIEGINFGLEQSALEDILRHSMWDPQSRLVLINFLENYKTAYALERLDYLNAVFSDDALIIVGNRLPQTKVSEITAFDKESFAHNKLTKSQYMQQLERVFAKQEYVNIQFEDAAVKKTNRTSERYEIIIKQNYYSATYADKGYLYLLADISDPEQPVIYVRVWDENRNNLMNYGEWIF